MELFGSSGTRGVVGSEMTPGFVVRVAAAAGQVLEGDRVAIGRDTRRTGPMLADAAASGLMSVGVDVRRLGVVPTPGVQAYARRNAMPALIVTASHNPPEYNGVKLIDADGIEADIDTLEAVEAAVLAATEADAGGQQAPTNTRDAAPTLAEWSEVGETVQVCGANEEYTAEVLDGVQGESIEAAGLTVALDPGHGAGIETTTAVLRSLGCRVISINAQPDGRFPGRDPEPIEANLGDLRHLVRSTDADIGIAHDGDADRAMFVDERGGFVNGEAILAALAEATLTPGDTAVAAVTVSQRLVDVVSAADASLKLTRVGSTYIVQRIRELQAAGETVPIAGEGNGGVYVPPYALRRDGAFLAARVLELVVKRGDPLSAIVEPFDDYENVRFDIEYESAAQRDAMAAAVEALANEPPTAGGGDAGVESDAKPDSPSVTRTDGVRIDYGDAWILARPSGTEPLFRIYGESRREGDASALATAARDAVVEARDQAA